MPKKPALEYSAAEPAFLRRIKAGNAELDGRHNVQIPRARGNAGKGGRLDMGGDDGEDDPVMLDESGNVVTKEEMDAKEARVDEERTVVGPDVGAKEGTEAEEERKVKDVEGGVSSGFGKKRKAVKVIGDDDAAEASRDDQDGLNEPTKSLTESTKDLKDVVATQKDDAKKEAAAGPTMKKGKRKKLKLSFDDAD
ncbi:hypothetical protein PMZ80_001689 [Knufia obscura]|uniref:DUF4604 domain-containing protein n=1 Tax=Knufia obscura TaxID=1635080 RepID=A0ABR0S3W1_9EURO|nr:hypothetical protein PMZ80_001689 [Knufia obscura]